MLLIIDSMEEYNEETNEFSYIEKTIINIEHTLASISKWESKFNKPFLKSMKTTEESIEYIKCMTTTENVNDEIYKAITNKNIKDVDDYINAPMTATTINNINNKLSNEIVTSEIIYYWMLKLGIPFECQHWHLNRLLTLIQVCDIKDSPTKKMSYVDMVKERQRINEERKKKYNTKG